MTTKEKQSYDFLSNIYLPLSEKISIFTRRKKVIVIAGPTAAGKTALSMNMARVVGGEIISVDSMQVYRDMDIGTAKASKKEMQEIPHHMINIRDIHEEFNVVNYYDEAHRSLKEILLRNNVPIIVGGSGFYLHVFLYGPPQGPPSDPEVRKRIEDQMEALGAGTLYERLQMLDPFYAETITENDKHKIIRALEIMSISEKKVSDFPKSGMHPHPEYDFRCWFVYQPKEILYPKIEMRCDEMIKHGFIDEVKALKEAGLEENTIASQAIGYKQCLKYLKTPQTQEDLQAFTLEFKKATRHYAKRQFTWFRKEPSFRWLNLDELSPEKVCEIILQDFEQG